MTAPPPRKPPLVSPDLTDHDLPGIGHRYELRTADGGAVVVVIHHSGRRDVYVTEPGRSERRAAVTVTDTQARTLGAILGGAYFKPAIVEDIEAVIGDLLIDGHRSRGSARQDEPALVSAIVPLAGSVLTWFTLEAGSPAVGHSLAELRIRQATGMTVAAIVRDPQPVTAPEPTERLQAGDQLVVIGRQEDLPRLRRHLATVDLADVAGGSAGGPAGGPAGDPAGGPGGTGTTEAPDG